MRIGKYEIVAELARGGMGVLYKARDPFIDRIVALKTLLPEAALSEQFKRRMIVEARAAGNLRHPNIVTIYDLGLIEGLPFIAMEFLEGSDLARLARKKARLLLGSRLRIVETVALALDFAHRRGVIHRDIKPSNIFITTSGVVKLVDFGIARMSEMTLTNTGQIVGTLQYMSPEQIQDQGVDRRADIFSLGVVLYELLAGVRPFEGETVPAMVYNVLQRTHPPIEALHPEVSPEIHAILDRVLRKNPAERYQSMADFAADLGQLMHEKAMPIALIDEPVATEISEKVARARGHLEARRIEASVLAIREALAIDPTHREAVTLADRIEEDRFREQVRAELQRIQELVAKNELVNARRALRAILERDSSIGGARKLLDEIEAKLRASGELDEQSTSGMLRVVLPGARPAEHTQEFTGPRPDAPTGTGVAGELGLPDEEGSRTRAMGSLDLPPAPPPAPPAALEGSRTALLHEEEAPTPPEPGSTYRLPSRPIEPEERSAMSHRLESRPEPVRAEAAPPRRGRGVLYTLLGVLVLLGLVAAWSRLRARPAPVVVAAATPSATPTATETPTPPPATPEPTPAPEVDTGPGGDTSLPVAVSGATGPEGVATDETAGPLVGPPLDTTLAAPASETPLPTPEVAATPEATPEPIAEPTATATATPLPATPTPPPATPRVARVPTPPPTPRAPRTPPPALAQLLGDAEAAAGRGDWPAARALAEQAVRRAPRDETALAWKDWIAAARAVEAGDAAFAAASWKKAAESYGTAEVEAQALLVGSNLLTHAVKRRVLAEAELLLLNENFREARKKFELAADPERSKDGLRRVRVLELKREAETLLAQNLPELALRKLTEVLSLEPGDVEARERVRHIDEKEGGRLAADLTQTRAEADQAFERGDYAVAVDLLRALTRRLPADRTLATRLAQAVTLAQASEALEAGDCERVRALVEALRTPPAARLLSECGRRARQRRSAVREGMVSVPAASFLAGDDDGAPAARPAHAQALRAFWIDAREVSAQAYAAYCADTGKAVPDRAEGAMTGVSFGDAEAYCKWAGKRLPSEFEWEWAARNPALGTQMQGMLDAVAEWTASWFEPYPESDADDPRFGQKQRVVRGRGSGRMGAAARDALPPGTRDPGVGFRCAIGAGELNRLPE